MDKALGLLGLAKKAGRLCVGEDAVREAALTGKAVLVLLASDAGAAVRRKAETLEKNSKTGRLVMPYTKNEIGAAVGKTLCSVAAMTDEGFAKGLLDCFDGEDTGNKSDTDCCSESGRNYL